jgi:hypothetical protein
MNLKSLDINERHPQDPQNSWVTSLGTLWLSTSALREGYYYMWLKDYDGKIIN